MSLFYRTGPGNWHPHKGAIWKYDRISQKTLLQACSNRHMRVVREAMTLSHPGALPSGVASHKTNNS